MLNEEWSIIAKMPTFAEAEVIKLLLQSEGMNAEIQSEDLTNPYPGVFLLVESNLVHRAIWILKSSVLTDSELDFLATGELRTEDQKGQSNDE